MKIRVYYEDTDCGNVVYYANYLKYMERSRTEFMRDRGIELKNYLEKGFIFVVTEAHIKYRNSAHYNDLLDAVSHISEITSVTITFETKIYNQKNELLVTGSVRMACIGAKTGKACKAPVELIDALSDKKTGKI
jgi:acyl-CoA thioester hydrolase